MAPAIYLGEGKITTNGWINHYGLFTFFSHDVDMSVLNMIDMAAKI